MVKNAHAFNEPGSQVYKVSLPHTTVDCYISSKENETTDTKQKNISLYYCGRHDGLVVSALHSRSRGPG